MQESLDEIRGLLDRVRARWRRLRVLRAAVRASLAVSAVLAAALILLRFSAGAPVVYAAIGIAAVILAIVAAAWGVWPLRDAPTDAQIARFIEERAVSLDDRLVSAIDVSRTDSAAAPVPPGLMEPMLADAARRVRDIDLDAILPADMVRRAIFQAAAAALVLLAVLFVARDPARQAFDAASLSLFPSRVGLDVTPGNARIKAGAPLAIQARLVGSRAPVIAQLQIAAGDGWRTTEMTADRSGAFQVTLDAVHAPFRYRIVAGSILSPAYAVAVAHPPRVTRIDVDYSYPSGLGLPPRSEKDGGDIYAPPGTDVRVHVFTDRAIAKGTMALGDGTQLALAADSAMEFSTSLKVVDDNSYRVALADRDGFSSSGDTEYFIRTLADRPPEVRILKPATDRNVTRLEEVDIEAQAEDDYGVARLELVYSVRGGAETAVPLPIAPRRTTVSGRHTLFLEDLDVQPGDFISYYARARDLTRGTRPNEARSDIFFLQVKPYEQEFALAQSQGAGGSAAQSGIDELVNAQKEIVVATWKLDRRTQSAGGARSETDIRAVSKAEDELRTRVEQTSSSFRESTMRDPRRRTPPQRGRGGPPLPPPPPPQPQLKAGETMPEEDDMTAAATAMGKAVTTLDALKTKDAMPPEMEALNHLLKAQADVKKREVQRQQAGNGAGSNRSNVDMSALFDKELRKTQQTNYETKSSAEQKEDAAQSALDKIKDLARRQDELLKRQQEIARQREQLSEEELKRELEKLTRDQMELRQRAEELARQMAQQSSQSGQQQSQQNGKSQPGQQSQSGQQAQAGRGQQGQSGQGQQGQSGQGGGSGDASQRLRDASEQMRSATSDLRRQDPNQATANGSRALEQLKAVQRELESARPDERRRALGELQLEARQIADAERQMSSSVSKAGSSDADKDTVRRLAGDQQRLADRAKALQDSLKQQGDQKQPAAGEAAKDLQGQRVAERMQQAADALRAATGDSRGARGRASDEAKAQAASDQELARALDRVADKLASATGGQDDEARKLSAQLAKAQELRDKLDAAGREMERAGRQNGQNAQGRSAQKSAGESGRAGEGQQGGGGGSGTDLNRLREEYEKRLRETKDLVDQLRRDDPNYARGGNTGFTFEGQGMTLSAPGTEAFKQDFAKWEDLRRQATQALDRAEATLSKKLQAKESKDRLAAGADDAAPPEYKKQVDDYFKAIATKKKQ
ncbi:MAG: hypothetical protein LAO77_16320 [Acidobacteriia bacterium]|nr:hypothetical protein [Terriglobia bacterium]